MDIAVVAGEASGDRQAAALLAAIREELAPSQRSIEAWGIGGVMMREAGVRLICDSRSWGSIGVVESVRAAPPVVMAFGRMKKVLRRRPPDALVLVDFGGFNVRLGAWAKANAICPVIYYFPPGSWRRRPSPKGLASLSRAADLLVTPFDWSETALRSAGMDAR